MDGFEVVAADITSAAREMTAAARGVSAASPGRDLDDVGTALPGSDSAAAAAALAAAWTTRFKDWHDDAVAQGERLASSARDYDASDYAADTKLHILMIHTGGY